MQVKVIAAVLAMLAIGRPSLAQSTDAPLPPHAPTPDEALAAPAPEATPAARMPTASETAPAQAPAPAKTAIDNNEATRKAQEDGSYPLKDGGRFEPPASRPAPLWNKGYGRT